MGKVIKIILSTISTILLVSIILPLFVSVALNFSSVQNFAIQKATRILSEKMSTTISVGHIDIALFNRLALSDVYVEDLGGDTLLFAERVEASLVGNGLIGGNFDLGYIKVKNARLFLVQDSTKTLNLRTVLDKIKRKDKTEKKEFNMHSRNIDLDNVHFVYRSHEPKQREKGINFQHLAHKNLNIKGTDFSINSDSISMNLEKLSCYDHSGFRLDNFSSKSLSVASSGLYFQKLKISSEQTSLSMPYLNIYSGQWSAYANFIKDIVFSTQIEKSTLTSKTLGYFAPSVSEWDLKATSLNIEAYGTVSNFSSQINSFVLDNTSFEGRFAAQGLPQIQSTSFEVDIENLNTNAESIQNIIASISTKVLPSSISDKLSKLQDIAVKASFNGQLSDFEAVGDLSSTLGKLDLNIELKNLDSDSKSFNGSIATTGFEIGELLAQPKLGHLAMECSASGSYSPNAISIDTKANVNQLLFDGYEYKNITMNGLFDNSNFEGKIESHNEALDFVFDGLLELNDSIPSYNFELQLNQLDLIATNINRRDSISKISGHILANAEGTNIDNIDGQINISELLYINETDSVYAGLIDITTDNNEEYKNITMSSDFADIDFMSSGSYSDMFVYLDRALRNYLPSMSKSVVPKSIAIEDNSSPAMSEEYYVAKIALKEANNITGIFVPGLEIADGTSAIFMLNPIRDQISLQVNSAYIEKDNSFIYDLVLDSQNQGDSISLFMSAKELYAAGIYLTDIDIIGGARNNTVSMDTRIGSSESFASAYISTTTLFTQDSTGLQQVLFKFNPSTINFNNQEWFLIANDIVIDTTGVKVGGFSIDGLGQSLSIDGYASRNTQDTLRVKFNNFDLAPMSKLVAKSGYSISGRTSGYLNAISALNTDVVMAEIELDSVKINDLDIPNTRFSSQWDPVEKRASIFLERADNADRLVNGHFRPSDKRLYAHAALKGLDLSLLDPVLKDIIGQTEGSANADLIVTSADGKHNINGNIDVDSLKTTVLFTNVEYSIGQTNIEVKDNLMQFSKARISDNNSGRADMNLSFDMSNFKNLKYELAVNANRLMALNTTLEDNELFYGTVYTDGVIAIKGDKLGTNMYVTAQTSGPSEFYMPLSGSESASEADFISFESPKPVVEENDYSRRKRQIMSGQKNSSTNIKSNFDMNMQLNVDQNLEFQLVIDPTVGDIIRGNGSGTINMNINPRTNQFSMYGDYTISDGSYLFTLRNIINKKFIIEPGGTIQWTGDPVDALLDITAVYKLKTSLAPLLNSSEYNRRVSVDCELKLSDRLSQPLITFDVSVPNSDTETQSLVSNALNTQEMKATQFLWLLAVNSFYSDNTSSDYSVNIGASGTAVTGIEFLSNQLSNWLSSERFSLVPRYIPSSEDSDDEFGFAFSAELIKNKLVIEGEGSYGNDVSSINNNTNFTNDLTAYWLFDQQGGLKAKAFTRTVDDFDENQGLQESGIGIFYSESFNNLKDLTANIKRRFTRKKNNNDEDDDE